MSRLDRAKQFAPFSALSGLEEAIEEKNRQAKARRAHTERTADILNSRLSRLSAGDTVHVMYYVGGGYIKRRVTVYDIDTARRAILADGGYIFFDDIYAIKLLSEE